MLGEVSEQVLSMITVQFVEAVKQNGRMVANCTEFKYTS
jgi:hypothetical protein